MDTKIFVMTHKKIEELSDRTILPEIYIPMQVGRAGKEDLGYLGDDSGDNISDKNSSYCELTGMYWLWKNMDCDIIGICHYRRFFTRQERLLEQVQIGKEFVLDEQEGVESVVYPDDTAPYYAGEMIGTFHIRPIQREVDFFGKENRRFGGNV